MTPRRTALRALALAGASLCAAPAVAAAQPYGWFSGPGGMDAVNLATGTRVTSVNAPIGVQVGEGTIERSTGDYWAITNVGTFRLRLSSPAPEPVNLPFTGSRLRLSPGGDTLLACTAGPYGLFECRWHRRSDATVITDFSAVVDAQFAPDGTLVVVTGVDVLVGPFFLRRFAVSTAGRPLWTVDLGPERIPSLSIGSTRVVVQSSGTNRVRIYDTSSGELAGRIAPPSVDRAIAFGSRLYVFYYTPPESFSYRLARYDLSTLALEAEAVVPPEIIGTITAFEQSADGRFLYVLKDTGGRFRLTFLETYDALALQLLHYRPAPSFRFGLAVSADPVCPFSITPSRRTPLQVPARGGVVEFRIDTEARCGPWQAAPNSYPNPPGLLGPAIRTGSEVLRVVLAANTERFTLAPSILITGVQYFISQPAETFAPGAPVNLRVRLEGTTPIATWSVDDGPVITGFSVLAGPAVGGPSVTVPLPSTARSWSPGALPPGNYFVTVRSLNHIGHSPDATPVSFSVAAGQRPGPPTNLRADVRGRYVRLMWDGPAAPPLASRYVIEAGPAAGPRAVVAQTTDSTPEFAFGNVPVGTWSVAVRAVNGAGTSDSSNVVTITTAQCAAPPDPPAGFSAVATGTSVSLAWQVPAGGADAFLLEAGSNIGASDLAQITMPVSETRMDANAPPGIYALRVRAVNQCGRSEASVERVVYVR